jgi:small subunit ribosomal protein S16
MLKIKLSRIGKKKHPIYRLIVLEVGRDPYGKSLEILGSWDPHTKDLQVKADRVKHWIGHGAQMTDTINNLFIEKKIIDGKKVNVSALGKKAKDAVRKAAEAKKAAEVAAKVAEATPEAPVEASETETAQA